MSDFGDFSLYTMPKVAEYRIIFSKTRDIASKI